MVKHFHADKAKIAARLAVDLWRLGGGDTWEKVVIDGQKSKSKVEITEIDRHIYIKASHGNMRNASCEP